MNEPLVTVLLSSHNGERYLAQALDSMAAQTYTKWEWVLVDNDSGDATTEIMERYQARRPDRIRMIRNEEKLDLADSLNRGLEQARGEFIARMDDDDIAHPDRLHRQMVAMQGDPDLLLVGTPAFRFDEPSGGVDIFMQPAQPLAARIRLCWHNPFIHASVMYRRLDHNGQPVRYPTLYSHAEDYGLWAQLSLLGRVHIMNEIVLTYRKRPGGMTGSRRELQLESTRRVSEWYVQELVRGTALECMTPEKIKTLMDDPEIPSASRLLQLKELFRIAARPPWISPRERERAWMDWVEPRLEAVKWTDLFHRDARRAWFGAGCGEAVRYAMRRMGRQR